MTDLRAPAARRPLANSLSEVLVALLFLFPLVNAASAPRQGGVLPFAVPLGPYLGVLVGVIVAALLTGAADALAARRRPAPLSLTALMLLMALEAVLAVAFARSGDERSVRNLALIALAAASLASARLNGARLEEALRYAFRIAGVSSLILFAAAPAWFVNASEFFRDSGKILPQIPNVQGPLSHPNFTGLYFAAAIIAETVHIRRTPSNRPTYAWLILYTTLLLSTQSRTAIGGALLVCSTFYLSQKSGTRALHNATRLAVVTSFIPAGTILMAHLRGAPPDFSAFAPFTNRGSLWAGVAAVRPDYFLFGGGSNGIEEALQFVTDRDVSAVTHAHNQPLTLLLIGGILPVVLYTSLLLRLSGLARTRASDTGTLTASAFALLLAITSVSESPFMPYLSQIGVVLTILAAALALRPGGTRVLAASLSHISSSSTGTSFR